MFLDATVVRMLLVPATMELFGDRNWWLPRWLDRIIPHVNVEGSSSQLTPEAAALAALSDDAEGDIVGVGASAHGPEGVE